MHIKLRTTLTALVFVASPVAAQDLPTNQLEQHADTVRQGTLLRQTLGRSTARQNGRRATGTARQAEACANRARFSREYGADHPKVRQLNSLCARSGY